MRWILSEILHENIPNVAVLLSTFPFLLKNQAGFLTYTGKSTENLLYLYQDHFTRIPNYMYYRKNKCSPHIQSIDKIALPLSIFPTRKSWENFFFSPASLGDMEWCSRFHMRGHLVPGPAVGQILVPYYGAATANKYALWKTKWKIDFSA